MGSSVGPTFYFLRILGNASCLFVYVYNTEYVIFYLFWVPSTDQRDTIFPVIETENTKSGDDVGSFCLLLLLFLSLGVKVKVSKGF